MIARLLAKLLPRGNWKRRFEEIAALRRLPVAEAGVASDGVPFVRLADGPIFYGLPPSRVHRIVHRLLMGRAYRRRIPLAAARVPWDILHRYLEGGQCNQQAHCQLKPGDTVVEAGAFIGYYSLRMAQDVGPAGKVVTIEPVDGNRRLIQRNVAANGLENVIILPYAISDRSGSVTFYATELQKNSLIEEIARLRGRPRPIPVPARTIDEVIEETGIAAPRLVILTINGAELQALEGMPRTLGGDGLQLVVASKYARGGRVLLDDIVRFLRSRRYAVTLDSDAFIKNEDSRRSAVVYAAPEPSP